MVLKVDEDPQAAVTDLHCPTCMRPMTMKASGYCSICFRPMYGGFDNNACPINKGRCCHWCNDTRVLPARRQVAINEVVRNK